jgi:uracil-DNA glycosylase
MMKLEKSWHEELKGEIGAPYVHELKAFLAKEKGRGAVVYPSEDSVFNAFLQTPFEKVRVVIVGQDPYHGPGQAHGLCFSVQEGVDMPPSLLNIFKELRQDLGIVMPKTGCLLEWAKQGVLLLNATLTVRSGEARSHYGMGWERFTDAVVARLVARKEPIVFLLWGKSAQEKVNRVLPATGTHHAVLMAAHPSPLSAYNGFFGCRHFSKTNSFLRQWGKPEIRWQL